MDAVIDTPTSVADVPEPVFTLVYEQKNITNDIAPYVVSVAYTDFLSGQSDEIEVVLEDADGRWLDAWYPGKGDALTLKIGYTGAPLLACGRFEIDEIAFDEPPSTVTIRGLGTGVKASVRSRKAKAYEHTTLATIAARVAKRNHLTLTGRIRDIRIDRVTQYQEQDVAFLTRLAREYGYAFKISGSKLIFSELADLRGSDAILQFKRADLKSIRLRDKIKDVYAQAKVGYHNPKTKKLVVYGVTGDSVGVVGQSEVAAGKRKQSGQSTSGDTLRLSARAGSKATLQTKARAALDQTNLKQTGGSVEMRGDTKLAAGASIELLELGRLSGKYLIESARHRLDRGGGYQTEVELKRSAIAVRAGKGSSTAKKSTKGLQVYGVTAKGDVGVVGTTPVAAKGKKK
ncbi:Cro/Cl family transcriptional regulator [Burkholderia cenocepacia]|uniref:phage late control D family protein n=1 Tax=Burkholderia cenocepacia TaxID=95486 RepID=UPI00078E525B|nr:phage late control D family protein [Burkholderia cenocepacia]AMU13840.1 Cro/Cl family transcriptional regulator [Burkholderia cenocepacia]